MNEIYLNKKNQLIQNNGFELKFSDIKQANEFLLAFNIIEEIQNPNLVLDKKLGYYYIYFPTHPLANASGKLYAHRYFYSIGNNVYPKKDEIVHHIDENRTNNDICNLELHTNAEHALLHAMLRPKTEYNCIVCNIRCDTKRKFCSTLCRTGLIEEIRRTAKPNSSLSEEEQYLLAESIRELSWEIPRYKICEELNITYDRFKFLAKKFEIYEKPAGFWSKTENRIGTPRKKIYLVPLKVHEKKFDPSYEELKEMVWKMSTVKVAAHYGVSDKAVEKRCKKLGIDKPPRGYWAKHASLASQEE